MTCYYAQAYPTYHFPKEPLFKQPLPPAVQDAIRPLITFGGVEFHYVKGKALSFSHHKPGVIVSTADWAIHILARMPDSDTYWHYAVIAPDTMGFFLEDWSLEKAEHLAKQLPQLNPISDFEEFAKCLRRPR